MREVYRWKVSEEWVATLYKNIMFRAPEETYGVTTQGIHKRIVW